MAGHPRMKEREQEKGKKEEEGEREEGGGKGEKEKRREKEKKRRGEGDAGEKGKDRGETGPNTGRPRRPNPTAKNETPPPWAPPFKNFRLRR